MLVKTFAFGDKVVHTGRPEWGVGTVSQTADDVHEGRSCQRLTVRFERAGIKTLSTGVATLVPATDAPALTQHEAAPGDPFLSGGAKSVHELMLRIADVASDPFQPVRVRLDATIKLYRFNEHAGALIDWAAGQSGLKDPLSRFSRHELEDLFRRWGMLRDEHLRKLVLEAKKADPTGLALAMKSATGKAQQLLRKFDAGVR
jgi:hypothetical protein